MLRYGRLVVLVILLGWGGYALYHHLYYRYLLTDLVLSYPIEEKWTPSEIPANFETIVSQPFTYFGQGAQSYAFISSDGDYILKIFHFKHYNKSSKKEKVVSNLDGYQLAKNYIPEESGILFQQLSPETGPAAAISISDRLGINHTLELSDLRYCIQRKVERYDGSLEQQAKLIVLIQKERNLGLYDRDEGLSHNAGFYQGQPIHYDAGKLTYDPAFCQSADYTRYVERVIARLRK